MFCTPLWTFWEFKRYNPTIISRDIRERRLWSRLTTSEITHFCTFEPPCTPVCNVPVPLNYKQSVEGHVLNNHLFESWKKAHWLLRYRKISPLITTLKQLTAHSSIVMAPWCCRGNRKHDTKMTQVILFFCIASIFNKSTMNSTYAEKYPRTPVQ